MARLVVRLLGGFRVELDGEAVYGFETDKARGLLAYLIVEADRPHRRESLASLLWPDRPDTVARANLRYALSCLRQALACGARPDAASPSFLFVTRTDVQFNSASDYALDVAELEAFARQPAGGAERSAQLLTEALGADFLAGFAVPDSEAFQAWVLSKQEYFHRLAIDILDQQNVFFEGAGDFEKAVAAARLQLRLEPWLEEAHRRCMRGLALAGRRDEALRQYEACCRALEAELGIEPTGETRALYDDIRTGKLAAPQRRHARSRPLPQTVQQARKPVRSDAPPGLVAREDELGQLGRRLDAAMAGEPGLVFVSGDAGSGKTALLQAFAYMAMAEHPDLLVAGARCSPGGGLDAFAPLRRLAEMLFGDLANEAAWRLPESDQVNRLERATPLALASLAEHGPDLVGALVPTASVARRDDRTTNTIMNHNIASRRDSFIGGGIPGQPLPQTLLFDQLLSTIAAISRQQPLLLLFDDLHWVDEGTAAFLLHIGRELSRAPLLVLGAYRSATVALGRRDPHSGEMTRHPLAATLNELRRIKGDVVVELDRADGRAFVEAYVDTEPNRLGAPFRNALYRQTGGHALFTVETLRNLQARGELLRDEAGRWVARESLDWGNIPARVEAAIAERIDRLPEGHRQILSAASVQGDSFSAEVVAELTGIAVPEVLASLSGSLARQHHLVRPEGLQRGPAELAASAAPRAGSGQGRLQIQSFYRFTHHLFQKYLYDRLDSVERGRLHAGVAASLERQVEGDPAERERLAGRLAWHYETAGLPTQAARALLDAGNLAVRVSAFREALASYDRGLALLAGALLAGMAPSAEIRQTQRLLEVARLTPERHLEGLASVAMEDALARATQAWAGPGSTSPPGEATTSKPRGRDVPTSPEPERPGMMLLAEMEHLMVTGEFEAALAAAARLEAQARRPGVETLAGVAQAYRGFINHAVGRPLQSEADLGKLLDWLTPWRRAELRAETGIDLLANGLGFSALNAWLLGYPEQALARSRQAITAARADGAMVGEAAASALGASLLFLLNGSGFGPGRERLAGEFAEVSERCYALCVQQGLTMWRVVADVMLGRSMVTAGEDPAGIDRIRTAGWQEGRLVLLTDLFTAVLADSCLLAGDRRAGAERGKLLAMGLAAVDSKLGPAGKPRVQAYVAELHRLRGELLLARDGLAAADEALACFERALPRLGRGVLGEEQGALAWELRAAMSIVRLRTRVCAARLGEAYAAELAEARACLAGIYARFTEGFDFPDLQDAAALIGAGEEMPRKP